MANGKEIKKILKEDYEEFVAFRKMKWVGPFTIDELLNSCLDDSHSKPPMNASVYLVSKKSWKKRPSSDSFSLYVGSNTGKSRQFRRRVGDLIADMFGFSGHSSGGQSIYLYCKANKLNPKNLYIGWLEEWVVIDVRGIISLTGLLQN